MTNKCKERTCKLVVFFFVCLFAGDWFLDHIQQSYGLISGSVFRNNHSWWCLGIIWDSRDEIKVKCMQGKHLNTSDPDCFLFLFCFDCVCLFWGSHVEVLRTYSYLCIQGSFTVVPREPYGVHILNPCLSHAGQVPTQHFSGPQNNVFRNTCTLSSIFENVCPCRIIHK